MLFSAACLKVLPFESVAASPHIASDVVQHIAGPCAATWITIAMAISALGSMNSSVLSGARVRYAMARDGIFFKIADGIHPKFRTPGRSLIFQGILASLMALTGTFEELTNLFIFAGWIFYGFAVVALFRMRKTEPDLPRPYRCWGYPWACPFPLPPGFDGLTCEWGNSNYVNPPFGSIMHQGKKKGPTAWVRKAIVEWQKGRRVVLATPSTNGF